jgi:hypothetical protein
MDIGIAATTGAADVDAEHSGSGSSMIIFSADILSIISTIVLPIAVLLVL